MNLLDRILDDPRLYRLWQLPFAERKLEPVHRHSDLGTARRVLDVACGPGTNAAHFRCAEYIGIDMNERYVEYARERSPGTFVVADATRLPRVDGPFDFILVNSFLHHLHIDEVRRVLSWLEGLLTPAGSIHVLDLVLPERPSLARWLARRDRGRHARPLDVWKALMTERFEEVVFEPFGLRAMGVTLWNMVYFQGRSPEADA